MKSNTLNYFLIILATACTDPQEVLTDNSGQAWTISWETDDHKAYGTIYLNSDKSAEVIIEEPDYLFFSEPQNVLFSWEATASHFTLTRKDNGFTMKYNILNQSERHYELSHADELIVKISR